MVICTNHYLTEMEWKLCMGGAIRRTVGELCGGMACVRTYVWGAVVVVVGGSCEGEL